MMEFIAKLIIKREKLKTREQTKSQLLNQFKGSVFNMRVAESMACWLYLRFLMLSMPNVSRLKVSIWSNAILFSESKGKREKISTIKYAELLACYGVRCMVCVWNKQFVP